MAKTANASVKRHVSRVVELLEDAGPRVQGLAGALLGDSHPEDLMALDPDLLAAAIRKTADALAGHQRGGSQVRVEPVGTDGWCVVSVINENMPFLFDSVLGEINDLSHSVGLVVHPIYDVRHQASDFELVERQKAEATDTIRTSVIHVLLHDMTREKAASLEDSLRQIIAQVKAAVRDWRPMLDRLGTVIEELKTGILPVKKSDANEALAFLEWLRDDNFTLLGIREYDYRGGETRGQLVRADMPGLGILSDPEARVMRRGDEPVTTTPEIRAFLNSRSVLIVSKANIKSKVHRRSYMDYVGVKKYDAKGRLAGEVRIIGLFTSTAYTRSVMRIPYIRSKTQAVIKRARYEPDSHSGKALLNVLESYPRDEMFQVDVPTLTRNALAIVALADRPRVRVLSRIDAFDRFVSIIVYVPRDRYSSSVRGEVGDYLAEVYQGHVSAYYPAFPEGALARVHYIIGRREGKTPTPSQATLEADILAITHTWEDHFRERDDGV